MSAGRVQSTEGTEMEVTIAASLDMQTMMDQRHQADCAPELHSDSSPGLPWPVSYCIHAPSTETIATAPQVPIQHLNNKI